MERLWQKVQYMKGVGPARSKQLGRLNIESIFDLLWFVPRHYFNRNKTEKINSLLIDDNASIRGTVGAVKSTRSSRGMNIFRAMITDNSGMITAVWFNQPYLATVIKPGRDIFLTGKVKNAYGSLEINVTYYEIIEAKDTDYPVLPLYPLTEGLTQKTMRNIMTCALDNYLSYYPDILDTELKRHYNLSNIFFAFRNIHFPESGNDYLKARERLAFEELLLFQINLHQEKYVLDNQTGYIVHRDQTNLVEKIVNNLPFKLTLAQQQAVNQIFADMGASRKMNRLLQGDVGSGKTVVAALAMAKAVASGYQAALMAPTEILAEQHYISLSRFFTGSDVIIARLTGGTPVNERNIIIEAALAGELDILVGTHALIQDDVNFSKLGLVVIDEQHRFGVRQRARLGSRSNSPDVLVMTATPIPRTLALTVYGDLDLSVINELPPGRQPVKTILMKSRSQKRVFEFIRQEIKKGRQAYIVCPLVEESENLDLQAAITLHEELRRYIFKEFEVGLLHGRMKTRDKDYIMNQFKQGLINILVSTTVIEVGVDIPNASIIVVEQAERFGLSQLHQLRGRVGRGNRQSYCFLMGDPRTEEAWRRLQAMEKTNDGFELAREDLLIRGPGEFWGVKQHGLNQLKVADLLKDQKLIELTRNIVKDMSWQELNNSQLSSYLQNKFKKVGPIASN